MLRDRRLHKRGYAWVLLLALATSFRLTPVVSAKPSDKYDLGDLKALQNAFVDLAEDVRPSVVAVRCYEIREIPEHETMIRVPIAQGSGFVLDPNGFIGTNRHVIEGADIISVILFDGRSLPAVVQQADIRSDLAVLKIEADHLKPVHWGELAKVHVNQWAFACGNPFGLANESGEPSVTVGVISALGRQMTHRISSDSERQYYGNLIETSAPINPGNSGGPLFNVDGEVIGVVTAIETSSGVNEGVGFAIPIEPNTRHIFRTLKEGHEVRYGFLGVSVNDLEGPDLRRVSDSRYYGGAKIVEINPPNGPAALAGLRPNDVVVEVNGVPVRNTDHLVRMVGFTPVGSEVVVTYLRDQVKRKATITLGDRFDLLGFKGGE